MRIVTNTKERLVLRSRHTVLAGIAWGCVAILLWGIWHNWLKLDQADVWGMGATALGFFCVAIYFLRPAVFDFDRAANRFRWIRPGLLRATRGEVSLDSIKRVRVDTDYADGQKAHRIVVETRHSTVPLQHMYWTGDRGGHQSVVDLIRGWLA